MKKRTHILRAYLLPDIHVDFDIDVEKIGYIDGRKYETQAVNSSDQSYTIRCIPIQCERSWETDHHPVSAARHLNKQRSEPKAPTND